MKSWYPILFLFAASFSYAAGDTLVFLDLPARHQEATAEAFTSTSQSNTRAQFVYSTNEFDGYKLDKRFAHVVATSTSSCEHILQDRPFPNRRYVCALLQSQDYYELASRYPDRKFLALAIDQPEERQVSITRKVFPQLQNFTILESTKLKPVRNIDFGSSVVTRTTYKSNVPLSKQIESILAASDAIIALPDDQIYTKENIRTILFTAYTREKPVVGYSPGYVRAGALISAYTTPLQLMKQLNQILSDIDTNNIESQRRLYFSTYFSISVNLSVAESLSLFKAINVDENKTYTDEDFE